MAAVMMKIPQLLKSLRENNWYITAYPFTFKNQEYAVIFEDLRELGKGTKYFAVCLTFIDMHNQKRTYETYANAYKFQNNDTGLLDFFGISPSNNKSSIPEWCIYEALNLATPEKYSPVEIRYKDVMINKTDSRERNEGLCCYGVKRNPQPYKRSAINTAKTRLLRPSLFERLGNDPSISFCYRKDKELTDAEIIASLNGR